MLGFELRISGVISDRSANCAATTALVMDSLSFTLFDKSVTHSSKTEYKKGTRIEYDYNSFDFYNSSDEKNELFE